VADELQAGSTLSARTLKTCAKTTKRQELLDLLPMCKLLQAVHYA